MTDEELAEWRERLRAAVAETLRRRAARRQQRQQTGTARHHGLQQRHTHKLNREDQP